MKKLFSVLCAIFLASFAFSSPSIYLSTDFAYYPKSQYKPSTAHMSPITGAYHGLEGRTVLHSDWKIKAPLGEQFLLKDANFSINTAFELTPVSVRPLLSFDWTPVPFLVFSAGGSAGTGWEAFGFTGMCRLDMTDGEYDNLTPFKDFYYDYWIRGTFQFDTAAIFPGDWNHVVFLANYQLINKQLTGLGKGQIGKWQGTDNFANGWQYDAVAVLAYQMPLKLYMAGVMAQCYGYFSEDDFGICGGKDNYYGTFTTLSISPLARIHLTKKDDLTILTEFSSRRAFKQKHSELIEEPFLNYIGYEWYFRRIAFSWMHVIR